MSSISEFLDRFSPFTKAHSWFMGGAALSQAVPLLSAPVIARLYTPADFGIYAVFYGAVAVITSAIHLSLHNGILLADSDKDASRVALLALSMSTMLSTLLGVAYFILPGQIFIDLFGSDFERIAPMLPITLAVTGSYVCLYTWWIRRGLYVRLGANQLILAFSTAFVQIAIGFFEFGALGFVYANIIGNLIALLLLFPVFAKDTKALNPGFSMSQAITIFRRHRDLALYTTPAGLINSMASFLPDFLINSQFGASLLGQYSLANRMVNMPLGFFSSAVQDIFRQQASEEYHKSGGCEETFDKFFLVLTAVAMCVLVPLILILPLIFPIIFGSQWVEAGKLMQPLIVLIGLRFISSPLSYVWIITGHQRLDMFWQIGLLIIVFLSFMAQPKEDILATLWLFSLACGVWYGLCLMTSYYFSRRPRALSA